MMEFFRERFAPGQFFGWLCLLFACTLPVIWLRARRSRRVPAVRFSGLGALRDLPVGWAVRLRNFSLLLRTLAVLALLVALARPQAGGAYRDVSQGIAIQMVLDISGSMSEDDFVIDRHRVRRIDAVKQVFEDFVLGSGPLPGREQDLIGMTSFAMFADTACPLTRDHASLIELLRQTDIPGWVDGRQVREEVEAGFTSLGDAIVLATDDLRRAGEQAVAGVPGAEPARSRVMILLTDGADNPPRQFAGDAPSPIEAAKVGARLGIKIYTIGAVGSVPRRPGLLGMFAPRREVDEPTLQEIARVSGGRYFRATDTDSLVTVYREIDELERHATGERIFRDDTFAAKMAMLVALALLLSEVLLRNTRFRSLP